MASILSTCYLHQELLCAQVGDRRSALKLLIRHHCWQKLRHTSSSLQPARDHAALQELVTELKRAEQLELTIQILADIGETDVSPLTCSWHANLQALSGSR